MKNKQSIPALSRKGEAGTVPNGASLARSRLSIPTSILGEGEAMGESKAGRACLDGCPKTFFF